MRHKFFFILTLVLSFGLSNVSAQTPTPNTPKLISGGVLNGKAKSLPKPAYPAAARAVNASGAVNVQVTIDENGDVISATAVSGHPLLRQASEQAALASKFAPTLLQGQPVRVTGVIVYNFVSPMTLAQIGYELSLAENSQSLKRFQITSIAGSFPKEWEQEKEDLRILDLALSEKSSKDKNPQVSAPANVSVDKLNTPNGSYQGSAGTGITTRIIGATDENYSLDSDAVLVVKDLQSKIENRLSVNEKTLWSFKLGEVLGKLRAGLENGESSQANISSLNQLNAEVPIGVSASVVEKIKEIVESSQQNLSAAETKEKLTPLIENLRNVRIY